MIRKLTILASSAILLSSISTISFAGENGGGCGVGKVVMEGKSGKDAQIAVAVINWVVNNIAPVQAFAMTTGTLGCDVSQEVNNEYQREKFFAKNEDSLSIEMAQGDGDHLKSLASIMGIPGEKQGEFFSMLQENYGKIMTADDMLASIDSTMLENANLGQFVQ